MVETYIVSCEYIINGHDSIGLSSHNPKFEIALERARTNWKKIELPPNGNFSVTITHLVNHEVKSQKFFENLDCTNPTTEEE